MAGGDKLMNVKVHWTDDGTLTGLTRKTYTYKNAP